MKPPCEICVDPMCKGKMDCDCDKCGKKENCYRLAGLKPTIRITRKCTQSCPHCCFECSPKETEMMSVETARNIHKFMASNNITRAETMGGEFFLNPQWEEILGILGEGLRTIRLVTAGDWAGNAKTAKRVIEFLTNHPEYHVGLSKDRWHTNKHVEKAAGLMTKANILFRTPTKEEVKDETLVPIGRNRFDYGFFSMFGSYCGPGEKRYNFLIDEEGEIYKCGLGAWGYDNIENFLEGGFAKRFKEFNMAFYYKAFIMSCSQCQRAEESTRREIRNGKGNNLGSSKAGAVQGSDSKGKESRQESR